MSEMAIMVTIDNRYVYPLQVMLYSLKQTNPQEQLVVYCLHKELTAQNQQKLIRFGDSLGVTIEPIAVDIEKVGDLPVNRYYSEAMYYRLFAHFFLPETVAKILYLDPDILVRQSIRSFYEMDLKGHIYAGAAHRGLTNMTTQVNRIRLGNPESRAYINSGVLLIDLKRLRQEPHLVPRIQAYLEKYRNVLVLPDQDVLNGVLGQEILEVSEEVYNYDVRFYERYRLTSSGKHDYEWVLKNTVFLHYAGSKKPWVAKVSSPLEVLYKSVELACSTFEQKKGVR